MAVIYTQAEHSLEDVAWAIAEGGLSYDQVIDFVLVLDRAMLDNTFTRRLIKALEAQIEE